MRMHVWNVDVLSPCHFAMFRSLAAQPKNRVPKSGHMICAPHVMSTTTLDSRIWLFATVLQLYCLLQPCHRLEKFNFIILYILLKWMCVAGQASSPMSRNIAWTITSSAHIANWFSILSLVALSKSSRGYSRELARCMIIWHLEIVISRLKLES